MRDLVGVAKEAEELGYDSAWVSDHLFHASYVAERLGSRPYHEALTVLAAAAVATERIRLGTSVLVLPWHHPVRLAKAIASLDDLSNGRITLGVGVAAAADEYANLGIEFVRRGEVANEILAAFERLWADDVPTFEGRTIRFSELRFQPKPHQQPRPPILVGGDSPAAFRRIAAFGDGWHPLSLSANQVREGIARISADSHRNPIEVAVRLVLQFEDEPSERPLEGRRTMRGTPDEMVHMVRGYEEAGATELVVDASSGELATVRDRHERFRNDVIVHLG